NTVEHVYGGNGSTQQVQGSIKAGEGPFGGAAWFNPNSNTNGGVRNYLRVVAPTSDPDRFIFPTDFTLEGWFRFPVTSASGEKAVFAGLVEPTDSGPANISVPVLVVNGATSSSVPLRCFQEYRSGGSWFTQTNTSVSASAGAP